MYYAYIILRCIILHYRLLDILADRKGRKGISGKVLINGQRQPDNFKCACGYVIQVCSIITWHV